VISGENRQSWAKFDGSMASRDEWTVNLIQKYTEQLRLDQKIGLIDVNKYGSPEVITSKLVER